MTEETRTLHVYEIGPESYVAYDENDAWSLLEEMTGMKRTDDDFDGDAPYMVADDRMLWIRLDEDASEAAAMTAADWCAREGRGFLCSTEF